MYHYQFRLRHVILTLYYWRGYACQLPPQPRDYHQFREHLYSINGVTFYKDRIVISPSLRQACLMALHAAYQAPWSPELKLPSSGQVLPKIFILLEPIAVTATKWHHLNLPYILYHLFSQYILFNVCIDFFHYQGMSYLVIVDQYSNRPIVERV